MVDVLIKTEGVTKDYGDKVKTRVLHGIDLDIRAGEFTVMLGASGSGKSTLLNIIGALDRSTEGAVIIDGTSLNDLSDDELAVFRNETMGFVFQSHLLLPQFTVLENVLIPHMIYAGKVTPEIKKRAVELLDLVGLSHRQDNRANAISGGEQQRTAIARALINRPRMILADEPTGNLDTSNAEKVFAMLQTINREFNTSFIMVTHNPELAQRSDRYLVMSDGRITEDTYLNMNCLK
ncbi:MAG: ABC transporter ATP-binding protein [Bacillota bacterium]|jgi:lipoprotein-releasing system ATP-binding protein|nr:ABC transporter ATP-binding protein [Bacillota bacterium]NLP24132.1 ABC transporter ATP-binding protein [Syntrophomonadaceae bacterium]